MLLVEGEHGKELERAKARPARRVPRQRVAARGSAVSEDVFKAVHSGGWGGGWEGGSCPVRKHY